MRTLPLIIWAILAVALGWFAVSHKAPAIQEDIRVRSSAVVKELNPNAEISVDGRFVTVRGPEPSEEAKANTLAAANDVWGALGPWDGLWVPTAAAATAPEFVSAEKSDDGKLVLVGLVPSEESKAAVEAAAKAAFPGEIDNQLSVSGTGKPSALENIGDALKSLATLDAGSLVAMPNRFRLSGRTGDSAIAQAATALSQNDPAKWSVHVNGPQASSASMAGRFNVVKGADGSLLASGEVSTDAQRESLLESLRQMAGNAKVVDHLAVRADGLPENWSGRIDHGLNALDGLDWGSLSLDGEQSNLYGSGSADTIEAAKGILREGWTFDLTAVAADETADQLSEPKAALREAQNSAGKAAADAGAATDKATADSKRAGDARIAELEALVAAKSSQPTASDAVPAVASCNERMARSLDGRTIEFATGSERIAAEGLSLIDRIASEGAACLDAGLRVNVSGYTDAQGSEASNIALSQRRAAAVKRALVARGFADDAITTAGFGEAQPTASNDTAQGRAQNRRITFDWSVR